MKTFITQASYRWVLLPVLLSLMCAGAFAQANSNITGIISDQSGAVIPGATVVLVHSSTARSR